MEISLAGKGAVGTGAGPKNGGGIAPGLAKNGAKVAWKDIDLLAAKTCVGRIERNEWTAMAGTGGGSDEEDVKAYLGEVLDRWGRIDILINNAAILGGRGPVARPVRASPPPRASGWGGGGLPPGPAPGSGCFWGWWFSSSRCSGCRDSPLPSFPAAPWSWGFVSR